MLSWQSLEDEEEDSRVVVVVVVGRGISTKPGE